MDEFNKNGTKKGRSSCAPVFTVAKIDFLFKRMIETINEELGTDKEKIAQSEDNYKKTF